MRRGHANLLCIVPILTDDPRRESNSIKITVCIWLRVKLAKLAPHRHVAAVCPCAAQCGMSVCTCLCCESGERCRIPFWIDFAQDMAQHGTRNDGSPSSASQAQVLLKCGGGHPTCFAEAPPRYYSRWNVHFGSIVHSQNLNAMVPVLIGLCGD